MERALAAARAKFAAAAPDAAYEFLAMAELGWLGELQCAELARLRAQMAFAERRGGATLRGCCSMRRRSSDRSTAGWRGRPTWKRSGRRSPPVASAAGSPCKRRLRLPGRRRPAPWPPRPLDLLLDGTATRLTEGYVAAVPPLSRALDALGRHGGRSEADIMGWLPLATIAPELWDDASWHALTARAVGLARDAGALAVLPIALTYSGE